MPNVYAHISTAGTFTISPNPGSILDHVLINQPGTSMTIVFADSGSGGSTPVIASIASPAAGGTYEYDCTVNSGITCIVGGTPGDITVSWR